MTVRGLLYKPGLGVFVMLPDMDASNVPMTIPRLDQQFLSGGAVYIRMAASKQTCET